MKDDLYQALRESVKRLARASETMGDAMPEASDPLEAVIDEALWALHDEAALKMTKYQRGNARAVNVILMRPNEHERDILRTLVEVVADLCRESPKAADAVDPVVRESTP